MMSCQAPSQQQRAGQRDLRLALGLQVFEQFPNYHQAGALLGLAPNTQKALHAIDPALLDAAAATAVPDGRSISFDHEGACAQCSAVCCASGTKDIPQRPMPPAELCTSRAQELTHPLIG